MSKNDNGKQDLIDYLAINDDPLPMDEALKFLTHTQLPSKYRALSNLVEKGALRRVYKRGQTYFVIDKATHLRVPTLRHQEESLRPEWNLEVILGLYIKYLSQHRTIPARFRLTDMLRKILEEWSYAANLILMLQELMDAEMPIAAVAQLEEEFMTKWPHSYLPDKDIWDSIPALIEALKALGAERYFNDNQLDSISGFEDRRNVWEIESD